MKPIQIAVGSNNPVKINSAQSGFEAMFPELVFESNGFAADSQVSDQPMSCEETLLGATNRAAQLNELAPESDYFVGIEGGIETIDGEFFANAWIVIKDRKQNIGRARSGSFWLPPKVKKLVESGMELGHANDVVFQKTNSKHAGGAVGSLTGGAVSRQSLYEHAMMLALAPFKNASLYLDDRPARVT